MKARHLVVLALLAGIVVGGTASTRPVIRWTVLGIGIVALLTLEVLADRRDP